MKIKYLAGIALAAMLAFGSVATTAHADEAHPRVHQVRHRLRNQHRRIRQGVKSGQLTRREVHRVRGADVRVHTQMHHDRMANNGHLTKGEDRKLNHELNHNSKAIYDKKHNNKVR